jgi:peptide/nickel transport system substrate-binding protein
VRQAIRHAIDYDGIINNIMGGAAKAINTFIPEGFAGYTDTIYYSQDLDKARALMKEAGHADGFEVTMITGDQTPNPELAQAVQAAVPPNCGRNTAPRNTR